MVTMLSENHKAQSPEYSELLLQIAQQIPFYARSIDMNALIGKITSLDQIIAQFPYIDRSIVQENYNHFLNNSEKIIGSIETTGTTNKPLKIPVTDNTLTREI